MRLGDLDALSAFVGDLRSTLHKEQSTFKAMTQSEFEIKDNMLLNFQYAIDNAPTVEAFTKEDMAGAYNEGYACGSRESERPKGEWIIHNKGEHNEWHECPYCNNHKKYYARFCNYCGADMRGDNHE